MSRRSHRKPAPVPTSLKARSEAGASPGQLHVDPAASPTQVRCFCYGPEGMQDRPLTNLAELPGVAECAPVVWIDVEGLSNVGVLAALQDHFGFHPLAMEDVVRVHQRPKFEDYGDTLFIVMRSVTSTNPYDSEQISLFLKEGHVITFQERLGGDSWDPVRTRIKAASPLIRRCGADHLLYTLIDAVIDGYFPVLEEYIQHLEALEYEVFTEPKPGQIAEIHAIRRDLTQLRHAIWPLREVLGRIIRDAPAMFSRDTLIYLRDCHDHAVQLMDLIEMARENSSSLVEGYLSRVSQRTNEIMRIMTIYTSIFLPLSFIAGVYGMNFNTDISQWNMPELNHPLGYPLVLFFMAWLAFGLLAFFRRKGWL